jgi:hypothetical protein
MLAAHRRMSSITGRSASPQGEPPFDARICADVGSGCRRVRTERGLTLDTVGAALLLSVRQVRALEEANVTAFHNVRFFVAALRKYAQFAGLDTAPVDRMMPPPRVVPERMASVVPHFKPDTGGRRGAFMVALSALAVMAALAVAAGGGYVWWQQASDVPAARADVPAAAILRVPAVAPATVVQGSLSAAPQLALPSGSADDAGGPSPPDPAALDVTAPFGAVSAPSATWMFLRYIDNTVIERTLDRGERAVFEKPPVYLAVGSPDVELMVGSQRVNTAPFIVNGQLRLRASDFNALAGQADPPTAVPSDAIR